jgi:hypothetical protein
MVDLINWGTSVSSIISTKLFYDTLGIIDARDWQHPSNARGLKHMSSDPFDILLSIQVPARSRLKKSVGT